MASLEPEDLWDFDDQTVDQIFTETSTGNYALGYIKDDGTFVVKNVCRSDNDLNDRLHDWTGMTRYKSFKASQVPSVTAAFEKECRNYHDFGGIEKIDNNHNPDKPTGIRVSCPICRA